MNSNKTFERTLDTTNDKVNPNSDKFDVWEMMVLDDVKKYNNES